MLLSRKRNATSVCPKTGKPIARNKKYGWLKWIFPITGLVSLIWFLIRVTPKPSRINYPCQRVAFPIASGFIAWLLGLGGSALAMRKAKSCFARSHYLVGILCVGLSIGSVWLAMSITAERKLRAAQPHTTNAPIGQAKGIHPGRVVWVHDPNATSWDGSTGYWWQSGNTDQTIASNMMSRAVRRLAGTADIVDAWDQIFRYYNQEHGKGDVGYAGGEKIAIKVNLVGHWGGGGANYGAQSNYMNASPQMMYALLDQLVNVVGVAQSDITIGDALSTFVDVFYNYLNTDFPGVNYLDDFGGAPGRIASQSSSVDFYWSTPAAGGTTQDKVPLEYVNSEYLINMANLKGHYDQAGITLCAKNHYGSLSRYPYAGGYYDMHGGLPFTTPGEGLYRPLVDLMGHSGIGGKTLLYLVDGLYAGRHQGGNIPIKWNLAPFNNDWTSSLFASLDPVAIDSVGFDFLFAEWPENPGPAVDGTDDFLHEAAEADNPVSGTFYDPDHSGDVQRLESLGVHEHWNSPISKQYSRNLGTDDGIELVTPPASEMPGDLNFDGKVNHCDFAVNAEKFNGSSLGDLETIAANWLQGESAESSVTVYEDGSFILPWISQTTGGAAPVPWEESTAPDSTPAAYCDIVAGEVWRWTRIHTDGTQVNIGQRRYLEFDIYFDTDTSPGQKLSAVHMQVNDKDEWSYKWESKVGVAKDSYCWVDDVYMDMDGGIPDNDLPMTGMEWHHFKLDLTTNVDENVWPADANVGIIQICFGHDTGNGADVYIKDVKFTQAVGNETPYVYAGGDLTVTLPETSASLDATVYDDDQPDPPAAVSVLWEKISGDDPVVFDDPCAIDTTVTFPGEGTYVLRLTANDSELSASDEITVTVRDSSYPPGSVIVFQGGAFENSWQEGQDFSIQVSPDGKTCAYTNGSGWRSMDSSGDTAVDRDGYMEFDVYFDTDTAGGTSINNMHKQVNGDGGWSYKWEGASAVWIDGVQRQWSSAGVSGKSWHHFRFKLQPPTSGGLLPTNTQIGIIRFRSDGTVAMYLDNIAYTPY